MREDRILDAIDDFFATRIFGPQRLSCFRAQQQALTPALDRETGNQRGRLDRELADLEQRIERQLAAIEAGVDPVLVGERIRALKAEREQTEAAIAQLDADRHQHAALDLDDACAILDALPDLRQPLAAADPQLRRQVYDAFRSPPRSTATPANYD